MANGNNIMKFVLGMVAGAFGFHYYKKWRQGVRGDGTSGSGTGKDVVRSVINRLRNEKKITEKFFGTAVDFLNDPDSTPEMVLIWLQERVSGDISIPENGGMPPDFGPEVSIPGVPPPLPPSPVECLTDADCVNLYGPGHVCVDGKCVFIGEPPGDDDPQPPQFDLSRMDLSAFPVDPYTGFVLVPAPDGTVLAVDPSSGQVAGPVDLPQDLPQDQSWYDGLDIPANGVTPKDPTTGLALMDEPDYEHAPSQGQDFVASLPTVNLDAMVSQPSPEKGETDVVDTTDFLQSNANLDYDGSHYSQPVDLGGCCG